MRLSVVLIAPVYLVTQGAAFLVPHSAVRHSALRVQSTPGPETIVDPYANLPLPDVTAPFASPETREVLKSIKLPTIEMPEFPKLDAMSPSTVFASNLGLQFNTEKLKSLEAWKPDFGFSNFKSSLEGLDNPVQQVVASWAALGQVLRSEDFTMGQVADALDFKELGGWYIGIFSILLAYLAASSSDEEKMTPSEAVKEAMEVLETKQQIEQLAQATAALSKELNQIKTEKASRDLEVATMQSDLREMKNRLDSAKINERELKSSLKQTEKKFMTETQELRKELEKRAAAEEVLKKKLKGTEDKLKIEKEKVAAAEQKASEEVAKAKAAVEDLKAEKNAMKAELDKLAKEAPELAAQLGVKAPKPKQAAPRPKKPVALKPTFFASVEESVDELPVVKEVVPKGSAKKAEKASKKAAKKAVKRAVAKTGTIAADDDWSKLSPSTLKRKTVKDLSEYLQDKGQKATDANGKPLRKADLVDAVLSVAA